ncbi:MAG: hypothetical protein ABL901_07995 [Hyphomicrobiaceae bacterium]
MASELGDKDGDRNKLRVATAAASGGDPPVGKGEVTPEVARVVNLLQRLDKLHSKQAGNEPASVQRVASVRADSGGLSSLGDRASDRGGLRSVPSPPIAFSPQPLPPVRASHDLPQVLNAPLPVSEAKGDVGQTVEPVPGTLPPAPVLSMEPPRRDKPPALLIASVLTGLVAVAGVGLYQFQRMAPAERRDQLIPVGTQGREPARADAAAAVVASTAADVTGGSCAVPLTTSKPGVVGLAMNDPARAGQTMGIAVDDVSYRAAFDAKGNLRFEAPMLAQQGVVRWDRKNGPPCELPFVSATTGGLLRVALIWTGPSALDLHVIEPNAWFGGPSGHISSLDLNADQSHGAGHIQVFGDGKAGARAHVYTVEASRIAQGGFLNAFVKPAATIVSDGSACTDAARPGNEQQVYYQVLVLRTAAQSDAVQSEARSFSMAIGSCGAKQGSGDLSERIIVRN